MRLGILAGVMFQATRDAVESVPSCATIIKLAESAMILGLEPNDSKI